MGNNRLFSSFIPAHLPNMSQVVAREIKWRLVKNLKKIFGQIKVG